MILASLAGFPLSASCEAVLKLQCKLNNTRKEPYTQPSPTTSIEALLYVAIDAPPPR